MDCEFVDGQDILDLCNYAESLQKDLDFIMGIFNENEAKRIRDLLDGN